MGQHVENQQAQVDEPDRPKQCVSIGHRRGPAQIPARLNRPSMVRIGTSVTFTSGPAAMLQSVAPGRGGGSTKLQLAIPSSRLRWKRGLVLRGLESLPVAFHN